MKVPLTALSLLLLSSACNAMLVTPPTDADGRDAVQQAINSKLALELSPDAVRRERSRELAAQMSVLNELKIGNTLALEKLGGAQAEPVAEKWKSTTILALALLILMPLMALLVLRILTRRALRSLQYEHDAVFRAGGELDPPSARPLAPKTSLKEFLAMRAAREARAKELNLPEQDDAKDVTPLPV